MPGLPDPGLTLLGQDLLINWDAVNPAADSYQLFRANTPYLVPATPYRLITGSTSTVDGMVLGNTTHNYFYLLRAVTNCGGSADSQWIGEFDFALVVGN